MNFSLHDFKEALYVLMTLIGLFFVLIGFHSLNTTAGAAHAVLHVVPAIIVLIVGTGCVFFGMETYLLRDDPDVWR